MEKITGCYIHLNNTSWQVVGESYLDASRLESGEVDMGGFECFGNAGAEREQRDGLERATQRNGTRLQPARLEQCRQSRDNRRVGRHILIDD